MDEYSEHLDMRSNILYFPHELDQIENNFVALHNALRSGNIDYCLKRLNNILANPETKQKILNQKYVGYDNQIMTLLIESILRNQQSFAKTLIASHVNVNATGRVRLLDSLIDEVTPLWCAAAFGFVDLVKCLIAEGAIINKATKTRSTPLRAACYKGSLECVECLVESGANIHKLNKFKSSCLMIASYKGHEKIVKYLLSKGADVNGKTRCGLTSMHFAAQANKIDVIKLLIEKGAVQFKNKRSLTPILVAAERSHYDIVHYLLKKINLTLQAKIKVYELLGASFLNDKDNYNFEEGFSALLTAMKIRCRHEYTRKKPYKQVAAYNNQIESETVQALMNLRDFPDALHYESLIIRERILGENNPDLLPAIIFRGACYADSNNYAPCLKLWFHALQISKMNGHSVSDDLLRFTQLFCRMIETGFDIEMSDLGHVLSAALDEFKFNKRKFTILKNNQQVQDIIFGNMLATLGLITITSMTLEKECNLEHPFRKDIMCLIVELNRMNLRTKKNQTLLHLCLSHINVDNAFTTKICCFPNYLSMKLLIFCGADVNAFDNNRNTPLHYIGKFISDNPSISHNSRNSDIRKMVIALLNAGAHTDIINNCGVNPHIGYLRNTFTFTRGIPRSLKCLAAGAVRKNIPEQYYCEDVPQSLLTFINVH
ncbi:Hypothetical protein CINCED_3A000901 [Cinara cedri]|nr:Hypothetical protein CINCED_3A000901 [Cinara cedri]